MPFRGAARWSSLIGKPTPGRIIEAESLEPVGAEELGSVTSGAMVDTMEAGTVDVPSFSPEPRIGESVVLP